MDDSCVNSINCSLGKNFWIESVVNELEAFCSIATLDCKSIENCFVIFMWIAVVYFTEGLASCTFKDICSVCVAICFVTVLYNCDLPGVCRIISDV